MRTTFATVVIVGFLSVTPAFAGAENANTTVSKHHYPDRSTHRLYFFYREFRKFPMPPTSSSQTSAIPVASWKPKKSQRWLKRTA
jgi:hypothetical protein